MEKQTEEQIIKIHYVTWEAVLNQQTTTNFLVSFNLALI